MAINDVAGERVYHVTYEIFFVNFWVRIWVRFSYIKIEEKLKPKTLKNLKNLKLFL